ncbi:hypothetical protein [Streptomyces sp. NRRL S-455]|uniref:hypothetical protein n=1 Tax=Streptomyces sp. NRRL S-455 TaxID=1463908 RepID=UPI00068F17C8|nr:hypothetical protein [Streptomyces sp. NRRL S-455]
MTKTSRLRRRIVRERAAATRFARSLRKGRSLATHAIAAGVDAQVAAGVANGLRSVAKRIGMEPAKVARTHRTTEGRAARLRKVNHFTAAQVQVLLRNYKPRKAEYKAAVVLMVLAHGAPVAVRQTVRPTVPARELVNA